MIVLALHAPGCPRVASDSATLPLRYVPVNMQVQLSSQPSVPAARAAWWFSCGSLGGWALPVKSTVANNVKVDTNCFAPDTTRPTPICEAPLSACSVQPSCPASPSGAFITCIVSYKYGVPSPPCRKGACTFSDGSSHSPSVQISRIGLAALNAISTAQSSSTHRPDHLRLLERLCPSLRRCPVPISIAIASSPTRCRKASGSSGRFAFWASGLQGPNRDCQLTNLTSLFVFMQAWIPRSPPFPTNLC